MKLEEFDFDAPSIDKEARLAFRSESRCVSALYERLFPDYRVKRGWKVMAECVPEVTVANIRDLIGVLTLQVQFDFREFRSLSIVEKKHLLLETLHAAVLNVAAAEEWDTEPFRRAYEGALLCSLENKWTWRKPKWNPGRSYRSHVECEHDMEAFRAWIVIEEKNGTSLVRQQVIDTDPSEFSFVPLLGALKWKSRKQTSLISESGALVGSATVP